MYWPTISLFIAGLAGVIGLGLGLMALINPPWAGRLVRLQPDPAKREGRAELRANYGGLFSGLHLAVLVVVVLALRSQDPVIEFAAATAALVAGAGWLGVGVVRLVFARADNAVTSYNVMGAIFELAMGAALVSPTFVAFITEP